MMPGFQDLSLIPGSLTLHRSDPYQILTDACVAWHRCSNRAVKEVNGLLSMSQRTIQVRFCEAKIMTTRNALAALGGLFEVFGSAVAASRAVEANRQPRASDLRMLGIDPAAFGKIIRR
jgi:hypothetical protein